MYQEQFDNASHTYLGQAQKSGTQVNKAISIHSNTCAGIINVLIDCLSQVWIALKQYYSTLCSFRITVIGVTEVKQQYGLIGVTEVKQRQGSQNNTSFNLVFLARISRQYVGACQLKHHLLRSHQVLRLVKQYRIPDYTKKSKLKRS